MKRILCVAASCCDFVFGDLPRLPAPGEEVYGGHFSVHAGGGANTPICLGLAGAQVSFWTLLGDDLPGGIVRQALKTAGVSLVPHGQRPGRTSVSAVLSTREDRAFASFDGGMPLIENIAAFEAAVENADIVHTCLGYCTAYPIPALCRAHGKLLSVDCSFTDMPSSETAAALSQCDWWKGSEGEAMRLTGKDSAEDALKALAEIVRCGAVVTLGARGSIGMEHGAKTIVRIGAPMPKRFTDATGAGDAYAAGFLLGLSENEPLIRCMERGAALGCEAVSHYGGSPENTDAAHE